MAGLAVSLDPTSGEGQPGPADHPAPGLYTWSQASLEVGTYALELTAPGFEPIGDPALDTSPVTIVKAQIPDGLVAGSAVIEGETASVVMTPISPTRFCLRLSALPLPALVGAVVDGTGTDGGLSAATVCLTSVTGLKPPGPGCVPGPLFSFRASSFAAGADTLSVTAPGFLPLGTDGAGGLIPVTVQKPPGPGCLPGQDYCTGLDAIVALAPAS